MTFTDGSNFTTDQLDLVLNGTYACKGWSLSATGSLSPASPAISISGVYDPATDTLTWRGELYLRLQVSSVPTTLCPC